jgi:hypothetical protein
MLSQPALTNSQCPVRQVSYVTICGRLVRGVDPLGSQGSALERFAGAGYQQVRALPAAGYSLAV